MTAQRTRETSIPSRSIHDDDDPEAVHEWLVTNGVGGYASGTVSGMTTRRFHGLLVSALPSPHGRTMMLNYLREEVRIEGRESTTLGWDERGKTSARRTIHADFRLDHGLPVWRYTIDDVVIEKRLVMPNRQNSVHIAYRLVTGPRAELTVTPYLHFRPHEASLKSPIRGPYELRIVGERYEIHGDDESIPPLRVLWKGDRASFAIQDTRLEDLLYFTEKSRGYDAVESLHSPGAFRACLASDASAFFIGSTENWAKIGALSTNECITSEHERRARIVRGAVPSAQKDFGAELAIAADQFVIHPIGRVVDFTRAAAVGDELRTVVAGYPWFTDWGRDTMISLEGLTLATNRFAEARYILRTFARYVKDGLIPNMFPEGNNAGLYNTADATLWFFHALGRYLAVTGDRETLELLMPTLKDIITAHFRGTRFNIKVDPADGLLSQGEHGVQLTWMDAKVGDLVVTPRRGKAVEINALFYNALRLFQSWLELTGDKSEARAIAAHAEKTRISFNARFWYEPGGYLYDVVDGFDLTEGTPPNDDAFRPNQIFAISLDHAVLDVQKWKLVVDKVRDKLLTPVGLRTLAPGHPSYKAKYFGDLRSRDMAYHQGTVWAWLLGPFIDAFRKVYPDQRDATLEMLRGLESQLDEACVGTISEIFDAEPPFTPRGCVAQAWSVAETLRSYVSLWRS